MKKQMTIPVMVLGFFSALFLAGGCYTQVGTVRNEEEPVYDNTVQQEDTSTVDTVVYYEDSAPPPHYYATFSYYYPGAYFGFGWGDPWYWSYYPSVTACGPFYPSSWYWPYYGWYSPYYYPYYPHYYYGYYSPGYYYPPVGQVNSARDFGNTRGGSGGTGRRGSGGLPVWTGGTADRSDPLPVATVSRPVVGQRAPGSSSGQTATPGKSASVRKIVVRRIAAPRYVPSGAPAQGGSSGPPRTSGTSVGRSTPPRSPAPAPAPSGGTRDSGGSRGGGSRGGGDRR